jgi:Holliday junction DNA helicase RuvB
MSDDDQNIDGDRPSEMNDVAPSSLAHIIGQASVKAQVQVALSAAFADQRKVDHCLLVGPPGVGKSAMASVIAQEMATGFHEVLGQAIASPADFNALLLGAKEADVVHIDEAHELKTEFQTALYLACDQRKLFVGSGRAGRPPQAIPLADFTLLLSTTDESDLLQPLRDRMRMVLRFEFYSEAELAELLRQRGRALRWDVAEEVLPLIAQRSRGTPRLALRLLQSCRRVCRSKDQTAITASHLDRACSLEQIDSLGLGPTEQQYLKVVGEGASRLNVVASLLGLPTQTVSRVTEPFLMRVGLMVKDDQGRRHLTAKGRGHLAAQKSAGHGV